MGLAAPLSEPAEELVGIDSHMHLDRCFSKRHGFGCKGRTLSDLRQHVVRLTGVEPEVFINQEICPEGIYFRVGRGCGNYVEC